MAFALVEASGLTNQQTTIRTGTTEQPAMYIPVSPNLTSGDSGNVPGENPLPGDRGTDLEQGFWHFYAIDVPDDNQGLLRTELQAISGNPDLYLREDGVPSIHHFSQGRFGSTLAPRFLTGTTTSYGN